MAFAKSEDHLDGDELPAEEYFVPHPERSMLVEAPACEWAGIRQGDLLVVERGTPPAAGDLVLVNVEGSYQIGQVESRRGSLRLTRVKQPYPGAEIAGVGVLTRFLRVLR